MESIVPTDRVVTIPVVLKHRDTAGCTVVINIKRNNCRLLHSSISISKKERRRNIFRFKLVTPVNNNLKTFTKYSELSMLSNTNCNIRDQSR